MAVNCCLMCCFIYIYGKKIKTIEELVEEQRRAALTLNYEPFKDIYRLRLDVDMCDLKYKILSDLINMETRMRHKEWEALGIFKEFIDFEAGWLKYYKKECREMFE